jgi:hypothetical protein
VATGVTGGMEMADVFDVVAESADHITLPCLHAYKQEIELQLAQLVDRSASSFRR